MSHVATIEIEIRDLADLRNACLDLGLVFAEGQQEYNWYGEHVGDFALPEGFTEADLGRCDHAIRMNDHAIIESMSSRREEFLATCAANNLEATEDHIEHVSQRPYEIGVVRRRDGKPGWVLLWDFWQKGFGLQDAIGENANRLKAAIATAASIRTMKAQGYGVQRKTLANGTVQLQFTK